MNKAPPISRNTKCYLSNEKKLNEMWLEDVREEKFFVK